MHVRTLLFILRWRLVWAVVLALVAMTTSSRTARADDVATFVGKDANGLAGVGRIAFAADNPRSLTLAGTAGYAFTEEQANEVGAHHRLGGAIGVAVQPLRFLAGALVLDGRWEKHPDDVLGSSSTTVGDPRLVLRAARGIAKSVAVGAQIDWLVPGAEVPSLKPEASRVDARALATFIPASDLAIALNVGYRRDGTENVFDASERARVRTGDRLTFGYSSFDAIVLGAGASKRLDRTELLFDLGWDVLLGTNAPAATDSPLWIGAGGRYHLDDLQLEARAQVGLSGRPTSLPAFAFAPIEPRLAILVGARWTLPFEPKSTRSSAPREEATKPVPVAETGVVQGRVKSDSGDAIANAHVVAGEGGPGADTAADGGFRIADVPAGRVHVTAKAAGFDDAAIDVDVDARGTASAEIAMKRTIEPGQLRGLVRSFNGKPLVATIRIEPIGTETKTDADGTFAIDVPPGAYEVQIAAPGHIGQKRPVQVEENGVTVLNADLRQGATP